ncbi:hypothetical protein TNCV_1969581 [Trichonephila clavipes]|nr:hypothetical protein TNCV_1969581 [Trichonephila clavipes]
MWLCDVSLPYAQSACRHGQWYNEVRSICSVGSSFPSESRDDTSAPHLHWFRPTLTDFYEGESTTTVGTSLPRWNSETWSNDPRCLLRGIDKQLTKKNTAAVL